MWSVAVQRLQRVIARFAGADPDRLLDWRDENLAVADFVGFGCRDDRRNGGIDLIVSDDDFKFHLWQKVDDVFSAAVKFGVALLAAETLHLDNGEALNANLLQGFFHFVQLERLDDGFDLFHRFRPPWLRSCRGQTIIDRQEQFTARKVQAKTGTN